MTDSRPPRPRLVDGVPDHVGDPVGSPSIVNVPNGLTILRMLLVPVFAWLLLREGGGDASSRMWSALVFAIASATDLIDGEIARRRHLVTSFGKVADPIADKALTGTALVDIARLVSASSLAAYGFVFIAEAVAFVASAAIAARLEEAAQGQARGASNAATTLAGGAHAA